MVPLVARRTREDAQHTMDDFEIEVSDLRDDEPLDWDARDGDMDDDGATHTTQIAGGATARWRPARSPLAPRLTPRDKLARAGVIVVAVLVACAFLVTTSAPVRSELSRVVGATPLAPQSSAGAETIYFEHGVPWGTLSLDGHTVHQSNSQLFGSLQIGKGPHTLVYRDPPFPPLRCHLDVPLQLSDTCPLEVSPPASAAGSSAFVRIVNLGATPDQLPPNSFHELVNAADGALHAMSSSTLVLPGSSYLDARGNAQVATRPLLATLRFRINTDPAVVAPYLPGQRLCSQICFLGDSAHTPGTWNLLALSRVSWSYAIPNGPVVVADAPVGPPSVGSTALVTMGVSWDGTWHAVAHPLEDQFGASPICDIAEATLPLITSQQGIESPYTQRQLPATTTADGCLIVVQLNTPGSDAGPAYVLYRFGVLLAVNSEARLLYPSLPTAGSYERELVSQMVGPGGFG
jgi:hypothetical protein